MFKSIPFISHVIMHLVHLLCLCSILQSRQKNLRHEFNLLYVFPPPTILLLNIQLFQRSFSSLNFLNNLKEKKLCRLWQAPQMETIIPVQSPYLTNTARPEQKLSTKKNKNNARLLSCLLIFHKIPWRSFRRFGHFVMQQILRQGRPAPAPSLTLEPGPHSGPAKL